MMASLRCSTNTPKAFLSSRQPAQLPGRRWAACRSAPERDTQPVADAAAESRVEALEAAIRGKAPKAQRQIPIRGVTQPQQKQESSQYADWKEGKLFPEGWEQMPLSQKVTELYMGQRGMLFWANKAALASSIGLGVAWVLFRLVLPNLGIYQLPGDLQ